LRVHVQTPDILSFFVNKRAVGGAGIIGAEALDGHGDRGHIPVFGDDFPLKDDGKTIGSEGDARKGQKQNHGRKSDDAHQKAS
jgi:hypothetical protein